MSETPANYHAHPDLRSLINDDAFAASFQSMARYRSALLEYGAPAGQGEPTMTTNKHLRELAEGVKHWGNSVADAWPADPDFNDSWVAGAIDEDGNKYPVIEVDADQYDAPGDSERLARFFTAANPATVLALLDAYEAQKVECEKLRERMTHLEKLLSAAADYATKLEPMSAKLLNAIDAAMVEAKS